MKPNELDEEFLEAIYHQANYDSILGDGPYSICDMPNLVSNYRELVEKKSAEEIAALKTECTKLRGIMHELIVAKDTGLFAIEVETDIGHDVDHSDRCHAVIDLWGRVRRVAELQHRIEAAR